jgi:hypothetical protein
MTLSGHDSILKVEDYISILVKILESPDYSYTIYHPENLKVWAKVLCSGEFKQGRELLCDYNTYCCLGVFAEEILGYFSNDLYDYSHLYQLRETGEEFVYKSPGYFPSCIDGNTELAEVFFIELNDEEKYSFELIAYIINRALEEIDS